MKNGRNFYFALTVFFLVSNISFALTTLPKSSYLRYGDNQIEVKILQEILNSDRDTRVAESGSGSPGKENWFFGKGTEIALKKFQQKYSLPTTGQIDFQTLSKLNNIAQQKNSTSLKIVNTNNTKVQREEFSDNPYIDYGDSTKNSSPTKKSTTSKNLLENNFLTDILSTYSSLFRPSSQISSTPIISNSYSAQTPYYNPQTGTYSNTPSNNSASYNPYSTQNSSGLQRNPYLGNNSGIDKYTQNLPFGGNNSSSYSTPTQMGEARYAGNFGGPLPSKIKELGDGWLAGPTTHFDTEWNGSRDAAPGSNCSAAMSSTINICLPSTCIVSLPIAAQVYFWGSSEQKNKMKSLIGMSAGSQVKALGWSYSNIKGSPIEIVNMSNNKCTVAPIWETGPGDSEGGAIDLTPCIKKVIGGNSNFTSKFRPVQQGKRGCEGYDYIPSTVVKTN